MRCTIEPLTRSTRELISALKGHNHTLTSRRVETQLSSSFPESHTHESTCLGEHGSACVVPLASSMWSAPWARVCTPGALLCNALDAISLCSVAPLLCRSTVVVGSQHDVIGTVIRDLPTAIGRHGAETLPWAVICVCTTSWGNAGTSFSGCGIEP